MIYKFLFPQNYSERKFSAFLLLLRILFGLLFMSHGIQKLVNFSGIAPTFPDPFGVGGDISLGLAVFAELFCSAAFIIGAFYRLSMLPMIVTMAVAFFGVHHGSIANGELAFVYMIVFILLYITGPGVYSIDNILHRQLLSASKKRDISR